MKENGGVRDPSRRFGTLARSCGPIAGTASHNIQKSNWAFPAFSTDKPVGPHGHALDLVFRISGTLDHPVHVVLIINLDVALGSVAERREPSANPFIDGLRLDAFLGGKRLWAVLAQVGFGVSSLGAARHDAE